MRGVSPSVVYGQYQRVLQGQVILTEYRFSYRDRSTPQGNDLYLKFEVEPGSKPPTNVHVLIGHNGAGKTTMFNNMIGALIPSARTNGNGGEFFEIGAFNTTGLPADYFSSVVSVSFSAFDPFPPPQDQTDRTQGLAYFYVGMKKKRAGAGNSVTAPKSDRELVDDFIESFEVCMSQPAKRARLRAALERLETSGAMAKFPLERLTNMSEDEEPIGKAREFASGMSSGQAIVLLTITKLVETVQEKTLVLIDEPESHLHPPLLSAFTRALSDLLHNRNGVAIVATHSPVVAQEVPKSCVWVLTRHNTQRRADRPSRETFGENVGILTKEIFGLAVSESGFLAMLKKSVDEGGTFESIMDEYGGQVGLEAQAILRSLIASRGTRASGHVR